MLFIVQIRCKFMLIFIDGKRLMIKLKSTLLWWLTIAKSWGLITKNFFNNKFWCLVHVLCHQLLVAQIFSWGLFYAAIFGVMPFLGRGKQNKRIGGNFLCFIKLLLIWSTHSVFSDTIDRVHYKSLSIIIGIVCTLPTRDTEYHLALSWDKSLLTKLSLPRVIQHRKVLLLCIR